MNAQMDLSPCDMEGILRMAMESRAPASLRPEGGVRMLGDLVVQGLEPGRSVQLGGAKRRDQIPNPGAPVVLTLLQGEQVLTLRTYLLDPIVAPEGDTLFPPVLRVAWPHSEVLKHPRRAMRVATPDLPPLKATLFVGGRALEAQLLNLTETGMGLGLKEWVHLDPHAAVVVETELPGGFPFRTSGEVRHLELVKDAPLPARVGLILGIASPECREALRRFVQARRTDRSEALRHGDAVPLMPGGRKPS